MSKKINPNTLCPCGSSKKYKKCCAIFHKGKNALSALELMKSRYSAFVVGDIKYIIQTSTNQNDYNDLENFSKECDFKKLEILEFIDGQNKAYVTFKATIFCNNQDNSFIEKSTFIKKNDRWLYEIGEFI